MYPDFEKTLAEVGWLNTWFGVAITFFLRYLLLAGVPFVLLTFVFRKRLFSKKIQPKFPKSGQIRRELLASMYACLVLGAAFVFTFWLHRAGFGKLYLDISERGWAYFFGSVAMVIFLHDTYFYWLHRLLHLPFFFRKIHFVHHRSVNTTTFTAFNFHLLESVLEFVIVPILIFVLPMHPAVLAIFGIWTMAFNVLGHCGYEFFPRGWTRHPVFRWVNSSVHHNLHHSKVVCNFGIYFNFWDFWMRTNHPDYTSIFEKTKIDGTQI